jgi:flagellar biosynthesis/type III secretory pathway chaperone
MPAAADDLRLFSETVANTLPLLERLHDAIRNERQALTGRDPAELEQIVQAKLALLDELGPLLQSRDALQQRLGVAAGLPGGDDLLKAAPQGSLVRERWDSLKALAEAIEQDNVINGQLAIQGEKAARMGISLLTGRQAQTMTYGRHGENGLSLDGLSLAKA